MPARRRGSRPKHLAYLEDTNNIRTYKTVADGREYGYIGLNGTNAGRTMLNNEIGQVNSCPMSSSVLPMKDPAIEPIESKGAQE